MRSPLALASAVLVGAFALPALAQPPGAARPGEAVPAPGPAAPPATKKEGSAVFRGRVTVADTGEPVRRGRVTVSSPELGPSPRVATTGIDGAWEITRLPAGRYTISAAKPPLVATQYGQRGRASAGRPVDVAEGQVLEKLDVALPAGGVISGRLTDDLGEPVAFTRVFALRPRYFDGRRQLVPVGGGAQTDDLGDYRLHGLAPGTYYVGIQATLWSSGSPLDQGISFPATFYPGTAAAADARAVTIAAGEERPHVNFGLTPARMARLSGMATDARGRPLARGSVMLVQETRTGTSTGGSASSGGSVQADGRFEVANVAPGDYVLLALAQDAETGQHARATLRVSVAGADLEGLVLTAVPGNRVAGRVEFDGGVPPPGVRYETLRINASEPGPMRIMSSPGAITMREDWSFELTGVSPGERVFRLVNPPPGVAIKSVFVGDRDITDTPLAFDGRSEVGDVRIVLTGTPPGVSGSVADDRGRPLRDYVVVVFPEDESKRYEGSRFVAVARPDQKGEFRVAVLPAGRFFAVALEAIEDGEHADPEFLGALRPLATRFALADGEQKTLALKLAQR
jgi:hypothetical protein